MMWIYIFGCSIYHSPVPELVETTGVSEGQNFCERVRMLQWHVI